MRKKERDAKQEPEGDCGARAVTSVGTEEKRLLLL